MKVYNEVMKNKANQPNYAHPLDVLTLITHVQTPDNAVIARAKTFGAKAELTQLGQDLNSQDDPWTACILIFHDHDWEYDIIRAQGVSEPNIRRIKAPIGLIPSMRDASMLAISTLTDVSGSYHEAIK